MATVSISKKEYKELIEKKIRYELLREVLEEDIFSSPSVKNRKAILSALAATKKYNKRFLQSIGRGLKRSSYFSL